MTRPTDWLAFARRVEADCADALGNLGPVMDETIRGERFDPAFLHVAMAMLEQLASDARALAIREETRKEPTDAE